MKRKKQKTILLLTFLISLFLSGCNYIHYWYPPAGACIPRPVYVYGKKPNYTASFDYSKVDGVNKGESYDAVSAGIRTGGTRKFSQGFIGMDTYGGSYRIGALDSIYIKKSAYGITFEAEGNLLIPYKNVSLGGGMYIGDTIEKGDYYHYRRKIQNHEPVSTVDPYSIKASNSNFIGLHSILNYHGSLDYTLKVGFVAVNLHHYSRSYASLGISGKKLGFTFVGILPQFDNDNVYHPGFSAGVTYRLTKKVQ